MSSEELKKILDGFYGSEKEKAVEYIISWGDKRNSGSLDDLDERC